MSKDSDLIFLCQQMTDKIKSTNIKNWKDLDLFLDKIKKDSPGLYRYSEKDFNRLISKGIAFITYDFGIDGVSIEISKYAKCLEMIYPGIKLHFIGGDFYDKADAVLLSHWQRYKIEGINGWSKWCRGKWFSKLYYEDMPEDSPGSDEVAQEIWRQTVNFTEKLGKYLADNDISLIIPVNIPTNPGNLSAILAIVIVTELLGTYVISSNHDFYWEGGMPASERKPGEEPGVRDHFFRNINNKPFFKLFKELYPWDGKRWLQVNINSPQSKELINKFGFSPDKVFELGTSLSDKFFEEFGPEDVKSVRLRMSYILSEGHPVIKAANIKDHFANLNTWMHNQSPIVCGFHDDLILDTTQENVIYCLQPTRVIARKRIEMDLQLLQALLKHPPFKEVFENDEDYKIVLHITGPVPIEHQEDLETVLNAYIELCENVPDTVSKRVFIAFSVGTEKHPSLAENHLKELCIEEIYRLATAILFPSETEGRGLPIVESSAGGIPIVCSRYYPREVFEEVVGENLDDEERIKYILFPEPEDGFSTEFLDEVAELFLHQEKFDEMKCHNKKAVRLRYSMEMIKKKFNEFLETLRKIN